MSILRNPKIGHYEDYFGLQKISMNLNFRMY